MITIEPFKAALFPKGLLRKQAKDSPTFVAMSDDEIDFLLSWAEFPGYGFMALKDGKVLAAAGGWPMWTGVGKGWAIFLETGHDAFGILKRIKRLLPQFCRANGWWRLQTDVRADNPVANRLAKFIGMKKEGLMEHYGPDGTDYNLYSRVN